ncbi:OMP_b-brl_3 domain-containing protein [Pseudomonas donghuensis]
MKFGSATRTRTWDPMINSHLLYRLSYRGTINFNYNSAAISSAVSLPLRTLRPCASLRSCL